VRKLFRVMKLIFNILNPVVSKVERRLAVAEVLTSVLRIVGLRVYNPDLCWDYDEEFMRVWKAFPEATPVIHERRFNLYYLSKIVAGLDGDTAECGVYRGAGSFLILSAMNARPNYRHHIFDSFEGLSTPESIDQPAVPDRAAWNQADLSVAEAVACKNLTGFSEQCLFYKGWIPTRFSEVIGNRFKLVHIDVDLYAPTKSSLEFFYSRMEPGGLIICDDYGSELCPGAKLAMDDFFSDKPESVVHLSSGTGFIVKSSSRD